MAKFKQEQIIPGVTKTRSNAVKVYCAEAIAAERHYRCDWYAG